MSRTRAPADAAIPAGVRAAWMGSAVQVFTMNRMPAPTKPLALSAAGGAAPSVRECVDRVLRLLSVGSKRFLTSKVDRSVTGLIAQQQTVGPLQASRWR
jgi:phosphoribosylformylglycinamidine (FGAM) synthase-like enzyme